MRKGRRIEIVSNVKEERRERWSRKEKGEEIEMVDEQ